ncbi:uncharacterized protein [Centruroides vittatus]|uniref:uncharacterized protein n=1 Tax=Centruroides vittatus TaxID=120091 RepID=UPI00350FE876
MKQIKDENGKVLQNQEKIKERWKNYFRKTLNEENSRGLCENGEANEGVASDKQRDGKGTYKNEEWNLQECENYRGINVPLNDPGENYGRKIKERRTAIGEEQFDFMPERGTTDAIFVLKQLIERNRRCRQNYK